MRRRYLLTYDVADDKRRGKLFDALKDVGEHLQFSVFLAELSPIELEHLRGLARQIVHHDEDQLLIVDLGKADPRQAGLPDDIEAVGRPFDPRPRVLVVG
jgi:CRISPR-associated protein Cas2